MLKNRTIKLILRTVSFVVLLTVLTTHTQAQNKVWTLEECVNYALENNISIQQTNNSSLKSLEDIKSNRASLFPSISASSSYNLSIGNQELFTGNFLNRTAHSINLNIGLSQNIFSGFRQLNLFKQSKLNSEAAKLELQRLEDNISLQVVDGYLNVLFNKENLETVKAQREISKKQLHQIKVRVEAGALAKAEIYDGEATLASDEQDVTTAENNYNLALLNLSQLLQLPYNGFQIASVDVGSPSASLLYSDVNEILDYAFNNRVEIELAEKNIEISESSIEIAKSGYYPTLRGSYGYSSNAFYSNLNAIDSQTGAKINENPFFTQLENQKGHNFNFNLSIPIFSQLQNKTAVSKAKIDREQAQLSLAQAKLDLTSNIQRAFTDAQAALKAYESAKKSVASQQIAFANAQDRFDIGNINNFDLDQARLRLLNAQVSLTNAKYDFVFKSKILNFYLGKPITR